MMHFRCDRCNRYEDKNIPNSEKAGIVTNYLPDNKDDLERSACLEVCAECYNNYLWWKGEGDKPRDVPIGPVIAERSFKFDIRVTLKDGMISAWSDSEYHKYDVNIMSALENATIQVLRKYELLPQKD